MVKIHLPYLLILLVALLPATALASPEKIVYHLHNTDQDSYRRAISNLENLYRGMHEQQLDIKVLLQGSSIKLLDVSTHNEKLNRRFIRLLEKGVKVEVSRENFQKNQNFLEKITPPEQISNIFNRIIELQQQGYHYVTP